MGKMEFQFNYFSLIIDKVLQIFFNRIVTEKWKSGLVRVSTAYFLIKGVEEFLDRSTAIKTHNLVGLVQKVNWYGVR